jgi:uncharacterized protein
VHGDKRPSVAQLRELLDLEPMPLEGGMFRRFWAGAEEDSGRPAGSAIVALLTRDEGEGGGEMFSAMHRLPGDEVWHFYLGDPLEMLLLRPDGSCQTVTLGPDLLGGQRVHFVVPAGTWMGAGVAEGGQWSLFGCTMAPGFVAADYEGGDGNELAAAYPEAAARIRQLYRPGVPLRHPADGEGGPQ